MKKKTKEKIVSLLENVSSDWNWKKIERPCNSWGCCQVHEDDYLKIDKKFQDIAKQILDEISDKKLEKKDE